MDCKEVIYGRRSIRNYEQKPVPTPLVQEILEAAVMAPSGTNQQPWYFCAITSPEKHQAYLELMKEVSEIFLPKLEQVFKNPKAVETAGNFINTLGNAPVVVLAFLQNPTDDGDLTSIISASAAVENLVLAAYDKGLGTCIMTSPYEAGLGDKIRDTFAPGKGQFLCAVTLGYPAQEAKANRRKDGRFDIV